MKDMKEHGVGDWLWALGMMIPWLSVPLAALVLWIS
jgi:hypothetical protein